MRSPLRSGISDSRLTSTPRSLHHGRGAVRARSIASLFWLCTAWFCTAGLYTSQRAWGHGDIGPQIEAITRELSSHPNNPSLLLKRADLHRIDGDPWSAYRDLRDAERAAPAFPGLHEAWARVHLMRGHPDLALGALDRTRDPSLRASDADELRARALSALGRPAEAALAWVTHIDGRARPVPDEYHACAEAYRDTGRLDQALSIVERGLARLGPCTALELLAVDLDREAGEFDRAADRLQRLAGRAIRPESWWLRRAELFHDARRPEQAKKEASRALAGLLALPPHVQQRPLTRRQIAVSRAIAAGRDPSSSSVQSNASSEQGNVSAEQGDVQSRPPPSMKSSEDHREIEAGDG